MNNFANVVYTYDPKNEDELKLEVGDKIEVLGVEEEGWWKGRLRGRVGVFPSNFVEVIDADSITSGEPSSVSSKFSIFFPKTTKNSLSTNSLNNIKSNSNNNINHIINNGNGIANNNNNNNNNLIMNNTQHQDTTGGLISGNEDPNSSERRPKPIRGVGYGDIFAAGGAKLKPLPADLSKPSSIAATIASERLSASNSLANTLQKQIPKKPPPPTPSNTNDITNGSNSADHAPALPPKPISQFSPLMHQPRPPLPAQPPHSSNTQQVRERARVLYAYDPTNDDELSLKVGDIIEIIDKDIEDAGWWKGELRGKVGVFPDNFVQLLEPEIEPETPNTDWMNARNSIGSLNAVNQQQQSITSMPTYSPSSEGKVKSVFSATPKGFSKELENNLEKHGNNPASLLSLKRNKLQQSGMSLDSNTTNSTDDKPSGDIVVGPIDTGTTKLNHITATRAKGPSRRPPSNVLTKRNQLDSLKRDTNGRVDDGDLVSLPATATTQQLATQYDAMSSLPVCEHSRQTIAATTTTTSGAISSKPNDVASPTTPIKPGFSLDNVIDNQLAASNTPRTSQRTMQTASVLHDKNKPSSTSVTPPWMVELRKAHAEKKRDTPAINNITTNAPIDLEETHAVGKAPETLVSTPITTRPLNSVPHTPRASTLESNEEPATVPTITSATTSLSKIPHDDFLKQISKDLTNEISELRDDVNRLKKDIGGISELKSIIEVMKLELKACQSATESQKRYIKELVNNLADERKKIAAMQVELDRNLK